MRARMICGVAASALALLLALAGPARAEDSVAITVAPNPYYLVPVPVTISGTAEEGQVLAAWVSTGIGRCDEGPQPGSIVLVPESPVAAGPFSVPASFTPHPSSFYHAICAVLLRRPGSWASTVAEGFTAVNVGHAPGAITIGATGPLYRTVPTTLLVTGWTDVPRYLHVNVKHTEVECKDMRGAAQTLTPREGLLVPAGPISLPFPFTPDEHIRNTVACAYLAEVPNADWTSTIYFGGGPITVGNKPPPPPRPEPLPQMTAPADGAGGPILNPAFTWLAPGGARGAEYRVTLQRVENGQLVPLLWMTTRRFGTIRSAAARRALGFAGIGAIEEIAHVGRTAAGENTLRLRWGLTPGDYVWVVDHPAQRDVPPRRFTVEPVALEQLRVQVQRRDGRSSEEATQVRFSITGSPYATIVWRLIGNGRADVERYSLGRDGSSRWSSRYDCATPGARYRWEVVATDQLGNREVRRGSYRLASRARCAALIRAEERALARRVAAIRRIANPIERFRRMCRLIGGTPDTVVRNGQRLIVCRGPNGFMRVPN